MLDHCRQARSVVARCRVRLRADGAARFAARGYGGRAVVGGVGYHGGAWHGAWYAHPAGVGAGVAVGAAAVGAAAAGAYYHPYAYPYAAPACGYYPYAPCY